MSVKDIQDFILKDSEISCAGCVKKVNLLKLNEPQRPDAIRKPKARGLMPPPSVPQSNQPRTALVLDAENCLDRLYGGCYPGMLL